MKNREEMAKKVDALYQAQAERDMDEREEDDYMGVTFEKKIVDLILTEITKAWSEGKAEGRKEAAKESNHDNNE